MKKDGKTQCRPEEPSTGTLFVSSHSVDLLPVDGHHPRLVVRSKNIDEPTSGSVLEGVRGHEETTRGAGGGANP